MCCNSKTKITSGKNIYFEEQLRTKCKKIKQNVRSARTKVTKSWLVFLAFHLIFWESGTSFLWRSSNYKWVEASENHYDAKLHLTLIWILLFHDYLNIGTSSFGILGWFFGSSSFPCCLSSGFVNRQILRVLFAFFPWRTAIVKLLSIFSVSTLIRFFGRARNLSVIPRGSVCSLLKRCKGTNFAVFLSGIFVIVSLIFRNICKTTSKIKNNSYRKRAKESVKEICFQQNTRSDVSAR